jgi:uncharacterized protein (TIGR00255 family)
MTGFGDAACEAEGVHYAVELRSINNRYYKASIRLPEEINGLEAELDSLLRKRLHRGSITLTAAVQDTSASAAYEINEAALQHYLACCRELGTTIEAGSLLALPGVLQPPAKAELLDRVRPILKDLATQACDKLNTMRDVEGKGLGEDLMGHVKSIEAMVAGIAERAPEVVEEYHQRLRTRLDALLARAELKLAEVDLAKEVAVFAERCDIAEETQRIAAHLQQFEEILHRDDGEPAGRTLDFLSQELLREANTIASKSNDAQIARTIVEVKGAIDRIKEQVQNVE